MAERIVPGPSLTAVATPVDRFVAPVRQEVGDDPMLQLARTLEKINPAIQQTLQSRYQDYAAAEEAKGQQAESYVDPSVALQKNRDGWKSLIDQQRQQDRAAGTSYADKLAAASPHFKRGLLKARAQRLGMALNDHLASLYTRNPEIEINGQTVGLQDIDDPAVISQWVQQETNAYAERFGLNNLDPVLVAETFAPIAAKAQDSIMGVHTDTRLSRYQQEYMDEMSANAGMLMTYAGTGDSDVDTFLGRLRQRESSGKRDVVNDLGYTGWFQFGPDRLADFNRATGKSYTLADLKGEGSEDRQMEVARWHINDIDRVIDENGMLDKGWSRDGLRAVAHLGGVGGMQEFVRTGGKYNPNDSYVNKAGKRVKGTSLMDYYTRFSGPASELQERLDDAVADGIDPRKANENIVNSVVNAALEQRNPALLSVLGNIDTGSGPLGNVGWVREKVRQASDQIENLQWQEETRAYQREERERSQTARRISTEALRSILSDPFNADMQPYMDEALRSGNPELVGAIRSARNAALDDIYKVRTNHEAYVDLRYRIHTTSGPEDRAAIATEIVRGTGTLWNKSDAESLLDALEQSERNLDVYDDDLVQQSLRSLERTVRDRFGTKDALGNSHGGDEEAITASMLFYDELAEWREQNPEASRHQARKYAREVIREILNSEEYQNPNADTQPRQVGEAPNQPAPQEQPPNVSVTQPNVEQVQTFGRLLATPGDVLSEWDLTALTTDQAQMINQAAQAMGLTAQQYIEKYGNQ